MVLFFSFSEKMTSLKQLLGTLQNGFEHIFGLGHRLGLALQNVFFPKNNEHIYKMVCSFFLLNANSLIHRLLSLTEWLQNSWKSEVSSTKWFVKYLLQNGFELFFLKTHFKTIL